MKDILKTYKSNYILIIVTALIWGGLYYRFGFTIPTLKYAVITPILLTMLVIDYKEQIIPNRLSLTLFEIALAFAFFYGLENINVTTDLLLGMLLGGGVFLVITLIGGVIAGREAMGFGDVKLMTGLGLLFGVRATGMLAVTSFLVSAVLGIVFFILIKKQKTKDYIPFGPFIVIATFITIFVPNDTLWNLLITIFSLGTNQMM